MFSLPLYKKEIKGTVKLLLIITAIVTLYVSVIIAMYDPKAMSAIDEIMKAFPDLLSALGLSAGATTLIGFMASYLYGFVLIILPLIYTMLTANKLIARYVDKGGMTTLLAAPVKRAKVALTQAAVLVTGIVLLTVYTTVLELIAASMSFPGELDIGKLFLINFGLLCLHLFLAGFCFFCSCFFSDGKLAVGLGAGVPILMFVLKMLANTGGSADGIKYITVFSLFDPVGMIGGNGFAVAGILILFALAIGMFAGAIVAFCKKDLHI